MIRIQGTKTNDDPSYRYKMHKPELIREKDKLVIKNAETICKEIRRDGNLLASYIGYKLGCTSRYTGGVMEIKVKTTQNILDIIIEFTENLIICKECRNPETEIIDIGSGKPRLKCEACGKCSNINTSDKHISKLDICKVVKKKKKDKKQKDLKVKSKS